MFDSGRSLIKQSAKGVALLVILAGVLMSVGGWLDPFTINPELSYQEPGFEYPFGTDLFGRDMLARTFYATGLTFRVILYAMLVAGLIALLMGSVAGYYASKWPDKIISWLISLLFTVPFILIVIAIFAVIQPEINRVFLAIGCIAWPAPARLVRSVVIQLRKATFIKATRAFGYGRMHLLFKSILPMSISPVLISLLYSVPELVSIEVGLSFFGLGAQPPTPTLGRLIYDGLSDIYVAWWIAIIPAAVLALILATLYYLIREGRVNKANG